MKTKRICILVSDTMTRAISPVEWKCKVDTDMALTGDWVVTADIELEWLKCQEHFGLYHCEMVGALYAIPYGLVEGRIVWINQSVAPAVSKRATQIASLEKKATWKALGLGSLSSAASTQPVNRLLTKPEENDND